MEEVKKTLFTHVDYRFYNALFNERYAYVEVHRYCLDDDVENVIKFLYAIGWRIGWSEEENKHYCTDEYSKIYTLDIATNNAAVDWAERFRHMYDYHTTIGLSPAITDELRELWGTYFK